MKRLFVIIAACAAALTLGSCQKNENQSSDSESDYICLGDYESITADFPDDFIFTDPETKAVTSSSGWKEGDTITVFLQVLGTDNVGADGAWAFRYNGTNWDFQFDKRIGLIQDLGKLSAEMLRIHPSGKALALYAAKMSGSHQFMTMNALQVINVSPETYAATANLTYETKGADINKNLHFSFKMVNSEDFNVLTTQEIKVKKAYYRTWYSSQNYRFEDLLQISAIRFYSSDRQNPPAGTEKHTLYYDTDYFNADIVYTPVDGYYYFFFPKEMDINKLRVNNSDGYKMVKDTVFFDKENSKQFVVRYTIDNN